MSKKLPPAPNQRLFPFSEEEFSDEEKKNAPPIAGIAHHRSSIRHQLSKPFRSHAATFSETHMIVSLPERAQAIMGMIESLERAMNEKGWRVNFDELNRIRNELLSINALNRRQKSIYSVAWNSPYGSGEEQVRVWELFIGDLMFMREEILSRIVSGKAKTAQEAWKQFRP